MSDATKSPSDDEKEKKETRKEKPTVKRRVLITIAAVIALLALLTAVSVFLPHTGGSTGGEQSTGQQTAIESPASTNADKDDGSQKDACTHDWTITYKTVHHDAVTHNETVAPVYANETTYHTVCNECKQVIDDKADEHIKETGHSGYSANVPITSEVLVSEGYTKEVTDTPAYDETVPDKMVCTICGAERPVDSAQQAN